MRSLTRAVSCLMAVNVQGKTWASSNCTPSIIFYNKSRVVWLIVTWYNKISNVIPFFSSRGHYMHDAWLFQKYNPFPSEIVFKRWRSFLHYWDGINHSQSRSSIIWDPEYMQKSILHSWLCSYEFPTCYSFEELDILLSHFIFCN